MKSRILLYLLLLLCTGCADTEDTHTVETQVRGRFIPASIYISRMPQTWEVDPLPSELSDTTLPIARYKIIDSNGIIEIVVHNFPSNHINERIPPSAQVRRWRQQLENPESAIVAPVAWDGFSGLSFIGHGVMGWAMQMHPNHYSHLSQSRSPEVEKIFKEMRADYTIKATGPEEMLESYRDAIISFATSFELKHEIYTPQ